MNFSEFLFNVHPIFHKNAPLYQNKPELVTEAEEYLSGWIDNNLPSGSGFDAPAELIEATGKKIVFRVPFHGMDQNGFYCGWGYYNVTVTPDLANGFSIACNLIAVDDETEKETFLTIAEYICDIYSEVF